ncbi:MAG: hypothetical protein AAF790_04195, partial [Planctomycetota bacterium]
MHTTAQEAGVNPSRGDHGVAADYARQLEADGFAVAGPVIDAQQVEQLRAAIGRLSGGGSVRRQQSVYGVRSLLESCPEVRSLAASPAVRS